MSYSGRVSQNAIKKEECKFRCFGTIFFLFFVVGVLTYLYWPEFWRNKVIWSVGAYLTFGSVMQNRYFDIKKNSNPHFANVQPGDYSSCHEYAEKLFKHMWVVGFALLTCSRWDE